MIIDQYAKNLGFKNAKEMHGLITSVDLTDQDTLERFNEWKRYDGSKDGLLVVIGNTIEGAGV